MAMKTLFAAATTAGLFLDRWSVSKRLFFLRLGLDRVGLLVN